MDEWQEKHGQRKQGKGKGKGKSETRHCYDCGEQGHIGVNRPYEWANSIDEEDGQTSSWESEPDGENAEEPSRAWRRLTKKVSGAGLRRARVTTWGGRIDSRPAFHYLAEDDEGEQASGGLNHLVSRNARGTQWTWKKVTVVVDSGAAENVMQEWKKGSKDQEERTWRSIGSKSCPSGPLRDLCTRAHVRSRT